MIAQARRIRRMSERYEELEWLEDRTLISTECFNPIPQSNIQPRAWDRIAVPTAIERRSTLKIYKRVSAKPRVDAKYRALVAELESQGLDERKLTRIRNYVVPYGNVAFESEIRPEVTGEQELAEARDQVKSALQSIWCDNVRLRDGPKKKRSSFDPTLLTWIPRKRHNTRWPINPPTENTEFIAKFQPLIKFELHPSQIDEAVYFEQNGIPEYNVQQVEPQSPVVPEPAEPAQQLRMEKPGHRRRTLRPSLSTISEVTDETIVFPVLTPLSTSFLHGSPAKSWQHAADNSKTPTKVADTPMKDFTLAATPKIGDIRVVNQSLQSSTTNAITIPNLAPAFIHASHFHKPPTLCTGRTASEALVVSEEGHRQTSSDSSNATQNAAENDSTYVAALPFFDQPIPDVQIEPEHESRRRFSLDNARRSDRTSDVRIIKRVHNWMAGASVEKKRRHSDIGALQEPAISKRRHTLDVDAGMNPDIFGQLKSIKAPVETPQKLIKPLHESHEQVETVLEHVTSSPTVCLQGSSQDEGLALSDNEKNGENEGTVEETVEETVDKTVEDAEENVEGDSDMAYLQNFVQRSKTSKEEKRDDVPSAPILLKDFFKKRRSGSMNSATSDAGSPMAKAATTAITTTAPKYRVPLGEKDANKSPSPSKKRKLKGAEDGSAPIQKKRAHLVAPDLDDLEPASTKRKKRRKGIESDTDDIFNPEMDFNQVLTQRSATGGPGARRSTRIATTQKPEPAPINVRVPGGVFFDNGEMPAVSTAGITNAVLQRKADQDLANKTKANTRKNRGGAVPVQMALAAMAEQSAEGDADEPTIATTVFVEPKAGRSGVVKTVRWDETLARVQGDEKTVASVFTVQSEDCQAGVEFQSESEGEEEEEEEEEDTQLPTPPKLSVVSLPAAGSNRPGNPVADQLTNVDEGQHEAPANKSAPVRRSSRAATVSRLPKRGGGVAPTAEQSALAPAPTRTPKRSSLPAPSRLSKPGVGGRGGAAVAGVGAAEARARLGMAGPGTPAPRRGGRKGGRR